MWVMQVFCVDGDSARREWRDVAVKAGRDPYRFASAEEALRMLDTCYPEQCRDARLGDESRVRVQSEDDGEVVYPR